jgi:HK97 family phage prohead protease
VLQNAHHEPGRTQVHRPARRAEVRRAEGAATRKFAGHGAVFKNVDSYGDVIEPGAFSAFLADVKAGRQSWPLMLSQHGGWGVTSDDLTPVGVWTELSEDGHGLKVEGKLADTTRGEDLYKLMKMDPRPAITGLSIGYVAKEWEPGTKPSDPKRRLKRIDVMEISLVSFPANPKARVSAVKSIEAIATLSDAEEILAAAGFSKTQAVALISKIKGARPGDPVGDQGGPGDPEAIAAIAASLRKSTSILTR